MKEITKFFDGLPYIVKIILAIPALDGLCWGIYRLSKGHIISGLVWIFLGFTIAGSIIDLYTLITEKKVSAWAD